MDPFFVQKLFIFAQKSGFLKIVHQNFMWLGQWLKMFALIHLKLLLGLGKLKFWLIWPFLVQNTLLVVTSLGADCFWPPPRDHSIARLFSTKTLPKVLRFFLFKLLLEKLVKNSHSKCLNQLSKTAVVDPHYAIGQNRQKWNFQVIFSCFSVNYSRKLYKYALKPFFIVPEAKLTVKNKKLKSAIVDPPTAYLKRWFFKFSNCNFFHGFHTCL